MCGRIVCKRTGATVRRMCRYRNRQGQKVLPKDKTSPGGQTFHRSYNVAPGAYTPVLLAFGELERVLVPMQWGLLPGWYKGERKDFGYKMNNCRSESMMHTASFKSPLNRGQRCVVLCDGFYEWKSEGGIKQPYFIYLPSRKVHHLHVSDEDSKDVKREISSTNVVDDGSCAKTMTDEMEDDIGDENHAEELMKFAGIYDKWISPQGDSVTSYSIITVPSSSTIEHIHHRMPAILMSDEAVATWINPDTPVSQALAVIQSVSNVAFHPVTTSVNNSRYNDPRCIEDIRSGSSTPGKTTPSSAAANFMRNWLSKGRSGNATSESKSSLGGVGSNASGSDPAMEYHDKSVLTDDWYSRHCCDSSKRINLREYPSERDAKRLKTEERP